MTPRLLPTIFIVDDDDAVCDSLAAVLETAGYTVTTFRSAEQFLDAYRPGASGCLIVDLDLPEMSGPTLVGTLVAREIKLPAVLMSGRLRARHVEQTLPSGVVALLEKPFGDRELLERVEFALGRAPLRRGRHIGSADPDR
jgi:FixJ family two-component response regulator